MPWLGHNAKQLQLAQLVRLLPLFAILLSMRKRSNPVSVTRLPAFLLYFDSLGCN
jgi:hypothetical protein